jgi:hypothetical protein
MSNRPNSQQRRAEERKQEAYGFAKLASLKIAPKSPPPKPRRKISLTLVVSVIIGLVLCGGAYVAYSSSHSVQSSVRIGGPTERTATHPPR